MPKTAASAPPGAPANSAASGSAFRRGWLSLNFKFSAATGGLLLALLVIVSLVVNQELRNSLTREVGERASTVARNLAGKLVEPIVAPNGPDELPLLKSLKDSLEEAPPPAPADQDLLNRIVSDLKASFNPASEIKNEGIQQIIVTVFPLQAGAANQYYSWDATSGPSQDPDHKTVQLPQTSPPNPEAGDPFPTALVDGRQAYEILVPIASSTGGGDSAGLASAPGAAPGASAAESGTASAASVTPPASAALPSASGLSPAASAAGVSASAAALPGAAAAAAQGGDAGQGAKKLGEVRLYFRRDVIVDAVRVATTRLVAVMLVSFLAGLFLLWLVVRFLFRPVGHLVRGVNAVAAGDFGVQLAIRRHDELGDLVEAYNGMAKSLAEKEAVQEALAKYTSKDLVNQMLSDKAKLDLGGQKVHATILFSVVRGVHALSQTMAAEEYVALINEYLEVETDAIMRNAGSIDKFIGDEVMAVWLIPRESGDDKKREMAFQAVKAAIEVQQSVEKLNADRVRRGEQPFLVSIGINNGEVVSGNMGSSVKMDYTVLGSNVNLAARLGLIAAQGGQTILSESVHALVADRFKIDRLAPVQLKGIKEPVPLYWPRQILPRS